MSAIPHVRHVHERRQGRLPQRLKRARASAVALIAALVGAVLVATPASAAECADGVDVCDDYAEFTWGAPFLSYDQNGDGLPNVGDTVAYRFTLTGLADPVSPQSFSTLGSLLGSDSTSDYVLTEVEAWMLDPDGSGPNLPTQELFYALVGEPAGFFLSVPAPPVFYKKHTKVAIEVEETYGDTTDGKPAEGDRVRYAVSMADQFWSGGWWREDEAVFAESGITFSTVLFRSVWVEVTQAHMLAGGVPLPVGTIDWKARRQAGSTSLAEFTETYAPGPVETEPVDASFDADYTLQWRDSTRTTTRELGEAQVGDIIDYTYALTNTGNTTMDYYGGSMWVPGWLAPSGFPSVFGALSPGEALHHETVSAAWMTSDPSLGGQLMPLVVNQLDIERGYVDFKAVVWAAPNYDYFELDSSAAQQAFEKRVLLREFATDVTWTAEYELLDTNGDGVGQVGEQITLTLTVTNGVGSDQAVEIDHVWYGPLVPVNPGNISAILVGQVLDPGESASDVFTFSVSEGGDPVTGFNVRFHGVIGGEIVDLHDEADAIPLGPYVAPTTMLDVSHVYADTNGDGNLSVGDTVTFTAAVENTDDYPLNGIVLSDAASDVVGTPPTDTTLAGGASLTWDVVHVLTLADFRRGTLTYDVTLDADGLTQLHDAEVLTAINFAAIEAELDPHFEGLIAVCVDGAEVTELMQGDSFTVHEGDCTGPQLGPDDKIYVFSTPVFLGNGHVALTLPTDLAPGAHKVAAYSEAAQIIGWVPLDVTAAPVPTVVTPVVTDAGVDAMPATGPDGRTWTLAWVALLALGLGGAAVALLRRRERER